LANHSTHEFTRVRLRMRLTRVSEQENPNTMSIAAFIGTLSVRKGCRVDWANYRRYTVACRKHDYQYALQRCRAKKEMVTLRHRNSTNRIYLTPTRRGWDLRTEQQGYL